MKGTADRALVYQKSNQEITGYTDADYASDATNWKSYTGYCSIYANAVVSWECRKQTTIPMSSSETEYMALSESAKEAVHLRGLLSELVNFSKPIKFIKTIKVQKRLPIIPFWIGELSTLMFIFIS